MKNNRLYYGHSGLCSMKLDGTDKKRHMRVKDDANGKVFYYKGKYFYSVFPYMTESYSVDTKYKHKKKYPAGNQTVCNAFVRAFDDMQFNESLTVRGYQYGTLIKTEKAQIPFINLEILIMERVRAELPRKRSTSHPRRRYTFWQHVRDISCLRKAIKKQAMKMEL